MNEEKKTWKDTLLIPIIVAFLATSITAPLSLYISSVYEANRTEKMAKLGVLRDLVGYRYVLSSGKVSGGYSQFMAAFNQICVVFNNSPKVIEKLNNFIQIRKNTASEASASDAAFVELIKSLMDDLELRRNHLDDHVIMDILTVGE